jgi:hypothetical protein
LPQVIRSFLQKAEFRIDTLAADDNLAAVVVFHKQQTNNHAADSQAEIARIGCGAVGCGLSADEVR